MPWPVLNGRQDEEPTEKEGQTRQPLQQGRVVFRNNDLSEVVGDLRDLVSHADKDERADDDVEHRVSGDEDQDAPCVRCQPDVVLADEQL